MFDKTQPRYLIASSNAEHIQKIEKSLRRCAELGSLAPQVTQLADDTVPLLKHSKYDFVIVEEEFLKTRPDIAPLLNHSSQIVCVLVEDDAPRHWQYSFNAIEISDLPSGLFGQLLLEKLRNHRERDILENARSSTKPEAQVIHETFSPRKLVEECVDTVFNSKLKKGNAVTSFVHPKVPVHLEGQVALYRSLLINLLELAVIQSASKTIQLEVGYFESEGKPSLKFEYTLLEKNTQHNVERENLQRSLCACLVDQLSGAMFESPRMTGGLQVSAAVVVASSTLPAALAPRLNFSEFNVLLVGSNPMRQKQIRSMLRHRGAEAEAIRPETFFNSEYELMLSDTDLIVIDTQDMPSHICSALLNEIEMRASDLAIPRLILGYPENFESKNWENTEFMTSSIKQSSFYDCVARLMSTRHTNAPLERIQLLMSV